MKPQNFRDCGEPWRLRHLFTNHLKLVNSIPDEHSQNKKIRSPGWFNMKGTTFA